MAIAKTDPKHEVPAARRLAAAPLNSAGSEALGEVLLMTVDVATLEEVASSEEVAASDDDDDDDDGDTTMDVDSGAKVELGSGVASTVGVSDCVSRATLIDSLTDSYIELAATSSDAVSEKVV
jgi:hypothetical protein